MKNGLYVVGGVLLVAAVGWAGWLALRPGPPEPVYDGERLSDWLVETRVDGFTKLGEDP